MVFIWKKAACGVLFLIVIAWTNALYGHDNNGQKPNVIIIMTDQQSADAMSFLSGRRWLHTPAMDKMASQGMVFSNAYAANPLCAPSRNSIISGRFPHQTGIESNAEFLYRKKTQEYLGLKSIGTYFKDAGYLTAYFGKWHLNYDPADEGSHGFEVINFTNGLGNDSKLPVLVDRFLRKPRTKPFLLFLSFLNPHNICEWSRFQKLKNGSISPAPRSDKLPPMKVNFLPPKNEAEAMALIRRSYHKNLRLFPVGNYTQRDWRRLLWGYCRLVEKVDSLIGRVLTSIEANGLDSNTVILFTSDHGSCVGSHQFVQKTAFYEESSRVPFILRYKGKVKTGINYSLVNTGTDILPTLLDFADIKIPDVLPGKSVKEAAENGKTLERNFIVVENKMVQGGPIDGHIPIINGRMVRSERYKYCLFDTLSHREELYDLWADPKEMTNLAGNEAFLSVLKLHRRYLREFALKYNDIVAITMLHFPLRKY